MIAFCCAAVSFGVFFVLLPLVLCCLPAEFCSAVSVESPALSVTVSSLLTLSAEEETDSLSFTAISSSALLLQAANSITAKTQIAVIQIAFFILHRPFAFILRLEKSKSNSAIKTKSSDITSFRIVLIYLNSLDIEVCSYSAGILLVKGLGCGKGKAKICNDATLRPVSSAFADTYRNAPKP